MAVHGAFVFHKHIFFFISHLLCLSQCYFNISFLKGGYFDFSHLTELKNVNITEIYMKKQYKSSRIKNHKITHKKKKKKKKFDGVPVNGFVAF